MEQHGPTHLTRRTLLGASAAAAGFVAAASASPAAAAPGGASAATQWLPKDLVRRFASPGTATAAGFRWWWPHGLVDPVEIAREVDQVADAGFGVLEVADVTHSLRARNIDIDVGTHGWGTAPWVAGVKAALARAAERDVRIDITVGPSWPAAVSTITPDDDAACTELVHGQANVAAGATYDGPVPAAVRTPRTWSPSRRWWRCRRTATPRRPTRACCRRSTPTPTSTCSTRSSTAASPGRRRRRPPAGRGCCCPTGSRGSAQEPEAAPHTSPAVVRRGPLQRARLAGRRRPVGGPGPRPRAARPARPRRWLPLRGLAGDRDGGDHLDAEDARGVREARRLRPAPLAAGRDGAEGEVPLRPRHRCQRRDDRQPAHQPGPRRLQPGALRPLPRPPPAPAAGLRPHARHGPAGPALRPRDRHHGARGAARHPRDRVARLQEPRRLPGDGGRPRHGRPHDPVLRGDLLQRRGLQHDARRQQRQPDAAEPGALHPQQHLRRRREPGDDPRLPLRRRART